MRSAPALVRVFRIRGSADLYVDSLVICFPNLLSHPCLCSDCAWNYNAERELRSFPPFRVREDISDTRSNPGKPACTAGSWTLFDAQPGDFIRHPALSIPVYTTIPPNAVLERPSNWYVVSCVRLYGGKNAKFCYCFVLVFLVPFVQPRMASLERATFGSLLSLPQS